MIQFRTLFCTYFAFTTCLVKYHFFFFFNPALAYLLIIWPRGHKGKKMKHVKWSTLFLLSMYLQLWLRLGNWSCTQRACHGASVHLPKLHLVPKALVKLTGMLKLKLQYCGHLVQRADSLEKTLMLGKTEAGEEATEDEMVGWHHWLNGPESEQTPAGDGEGQGSLASCSPWVLKELEMN